MVSFDKSKEPKIKIKMAATNAIHFIQFVDIVCKYCIALFFLIPLN